MSAKAIHLNLLLESERLSSSPVRPKVILPVAACVLLAAMLLWWVFLLLQGSLVGSEVADLRSEIAATDTPYAEACKLKDALGAAEAELNQCKSYLHARRTWGETLTAVATAMPEGIQLGMIEIPEPGRQNLNPPPGVKLPPLLGPTNELEAVTFRIAGKTAREAYVFDFLDAVKAMPSFTNNLLVCRKTGATGEASPRMHQFGQDKTTDEGGNRAIVFDVEYLTTGRRFTP